MTERKLVLVVKCKAKDLTSKITKAWRQAGLPVSEDKCSECNYAPILNWFNYCPMCVCPINKDGVWVPSANQ